MSWFHAGTYAALTRMGLIEERFPGIVHLTPAGTAALSRPTRKDDRRG